MLSRVHIPLIVCCLLINVCVSQIFVVIDPDDTEELYKNRRQFQGVGGESKLAKTEPQFYQVVLNGSVLYAGGRESLDVIDMGSWSVSNNVTFNTDSSAKTSCQSKNLLAGMLCYNYVTIIEPMGDCLFVYGTDAMAPKCYTVDPMNDTVAHEDITHDKDFGPVDPKQESIHLHMPAGGKYFSANGEPMDGSDYSGFLLGNQATCDGPLTGVLKNLENPKWLNDPHFVGDPIEHGGFVYFFFREFATEHINAGRIVYSRVARVCKNDVGGNQFTNFDNTVITYQKARLTCSTSTGAGENSNFMYNDIQDVSYDMDELGVMIVYAVFTISKPGPTSSAICVYRMPDIVSVFETSKYWGTRDATLMWSNPDPATVPNPRPGQCGVTYPVDDTTFLSFLEHFPLLEDLVQSTLTVVQDNVRYVQVAAVEVNSQTLMFFGTDRNSIVKAAFNGSAVEMLEEIDLQLGKPESPILHFIKDDAMEYLYISTMYSVYKLPLEACASRDPCDGCTKDPFCILNGTECVDYRSSGSLSPGDTSHCKKTKIEFVIKEEAENITTAQDQIRNLNFAVSARSNSNLSANVVNCDNCNLVNSNTHKSVHGNEEILTVQYSVKVSKEVDQDSTFGVTFTANGVEDVSRETKFILDMSDSVTDDNCIKMVQTYDKTITEYKYELQKWKNELIKESNCTRSYCNEREV